MGQAREERWAEPTHATSARLARMLVGLMVLVVLSFVSVFLVALSRGRQVNRQVNDIVEDALPGVEQLTAARGDLRRLDTFARDYADFAETTEIVPPGDTLRRERAKLDERLAIYSALPKLPATLVLSDAIPGELADLDRTVASITASVAVSDIDGERIAKRDEIRAAEHIENTLEQLVWLNASEGRRLGFAIEESRAKSVRLVVGLDALSAGLALLATALAVVTMHRSVRPIETGRAAATERASALDQRSAELDQFAGRVAHDVLSPLGSVSLALEILRRSVEGNAKAEATAVRAVASLQRVRRIVDGLLEFARAGARADPRATADLSTVIEDVLEGARPEATEDQIQLSVEPFTPCRLACSPGVLTSLCANLVYNAIRHMNGARLRSVTVRVVTVDEKRRRVEVDDTGPGVPPQLADTLFEPFVRAQGRDPGVGLGLSTVKRLAEGHGGEVGFRRKPEGGTVFWFELPVAPVESASS
jgi:signal transduction histidine kinase